MEVPAIQPSVQYVHCAALLGVHLLASNIDRQAELVDGSAA
jgi:hypothetical protein